MFVGIEIRGASIKLEPKANCGRAGEARTSFEVRSYFVCQEQTRVLRSTVS